LTLRDLQSIQNRPDNDWVQQIFILRPDNLGDVILFTGTLHLIRQKFPQAEIVICAKNYVHSLLELSPSVDKVISWEELMKLLPDWVPEFPGKSRVESLIRKYKFVKATMWDYRPDLYLLPVRSVIPDLHIFSSHIRASVKLGISGDTNHQTTEQDLQYGQHYTARSHVDESNGIQHELDTYIDFLKLMGIEADRNEIWPNLWSSEENEAWAIDHMPDSHHEIRLAIAPGVTSIEDKYYAAENYQKAIEGLGNERLSVFIFGSESEIAQCKAVEDALSNCTQVQAIHNFAGKTTILQLTEMIKRCDLLLSNETGVLHMATALKMPSIGILGGGHHGRFYPWGDPDINLKVDKPMDCYHCNWYCIYPTIRCIHEIKPEQITEKLQRLIRQVKKNDPQKASAEESK
tara:strand:+ start:16271 stop:17482 length:1212 start_codon:yes stop_codon:yes gene_type:complete